MHLLLTAATHLEIAPFIHHLQSNYKQLGSDIFFNDNHRIQLLITGVGMVATTYSLTKVLSEKTFDLVIQAGIAGSYDRSLLLGNVYAVKTEIFGDMGAEDHYNFLDFFELGLEEENNFPFSEKILTNSTEEFSFIIDTPWVSGISVNSVTGSDVTASLREKKYNCQIETMEGAAFHYVCLQQQTAFLQVRSISNYVEARDKSKWKMKEAVENLNKWLLSVVAD